MADAGQEKHITARISSNQKTGLIIFGIFLFFVLLEAGLRLAGLIVLYSQESSNRAAVRQRGAYRIMCLGESTTFGQYPRFLEEILNQNKIGVTFSVIDKGVISTSTYILDHVEAELNKYRPDMAIAMMGINDGGKHLPYERPSSSFMLGLLRHLRIYKFARLASLHIRETLDERKRRNRFAAARHKGYTAEDYIKEGERYFERADYFAAESAFKEAIAEGAGNDYVYRQLGIAYFQQGLSYDKAEAAFQKAIELNRNEALNYLWLGFCRRDSFKFIEAEEDFTRAFQISRGSMIVALSEIASIYRQQGKYDQAEKLLRGALSMALTLQETCTLWLQLGWLYNDQGSYSKAKEAFQSGLQVNPEDQPLIGALTIVCAQIDDRSSVDEYYERMNHLRSRDYNPVVRANYLRLQKILDARGITFVCMQYPLRSIIPLKQIFDRHEGVVFIENVEMFRAALKNSRYSEYFRDNFGGDFGHCTDKGNRLLAENIANTILREVFGK